MEISKIQRLQLEPTSHCNAACPHCPRVNSLGELNLVPEHWRAKDLLDNLELPSMTSLNRITIEGDNGDPLMHPEIGTIIDRFVSHPNKPLVTVVTNGSIRNRRWWKNLPKSDNLVVVFSIDGLADTNHIYRINLDFDKIIKNAKAFIDSGGNAVWKFIIFKHNQHQIEEAVHLSKELGFTSIRFILPVKSRFEGLDVWPIRQQDQILGHLQYPDRFTVAPPTVVHDHSRTLGYPDPVLDRENVCPNLVRGHIYVTASGYMIPCCMLNFKLEENSIFKELIGDFDSIDLHQIKLSSILSGPFTKNLNDQLSDGIKMMPCFNNCRGIIESDQKHKVRI